ncbi:MAG: SDR family NAD(P)-dependent oxidoreductase [Planctomycetota bacterium]|nr:SDR family NAD(P)-dependent oxidoreductase [Planctomycetota bacterium]
MQIETSTILITGGSSGLGAACVESLARRGAGVVNVDLQPPCDELDADIADRVAFVPADVTSESEIRAAIATGEERFGPLRGAVACAGVLFAEKLVGRDGPASLEEFRRVIDINLTGTFNIVRLAAEAIARNEADADDERGVIVMTSSVAAFDGQIGQASYSASKGGIASMALPLARELGRSGIRVVSIAPGAFETPMMHSAPDRVRQSLIDQTPFPHRLGQAHEFASLVAHVFENRMLNGSVLRLDGAIRMGPR